MHEASLVEQLLGQVRRIAEQNGGGRVTRIEVIVGELAGVEPDLVRFAFDRLASDAGLAEARLSLVLRPVSVACETCGATSALSDFVFRCPRCGDEKVRVVDGEQFVLQQITLEGESSSSSR